MTNISRIKLVALDMDGTLIGRDTALAPATRAAIAAAQANGVKVILVTGRMYQSAVPFARELGLDGLPLISYNGALVSEFPTGRTIYHEPVPLETCKTLAAYCQSRGYHLQAYVNDRLYVRDLGQRTQAYAALSRVEPIAVGSLVSWLSQPSTKLLMIDDPDRIPRLLAEVNELLGPGVHLVTSMPEYIEVVSSRVSKGAALAAVAASLGIGRESVMAMGDGMNDLAMLTWAGTSFAMRHAPEALRQAATHITQSGPGDGVVEAFRRMDLI